MTESDRCCGAVRDGDRARMITTTVPVRRLTAQTRPTLNFSVRWAGQGGPTVRPMQSVDHMIATWGARWKPPLSWACSGEVRGGPVKSGEAQTARGRPGPAAPSHLTVSDRRHRGSRAPATRALLLLLFAALLLLAFRAGDSSTGMELLTRVMV